MRKQVKFMRSLTEWALTKLELEGRNPFKGLVVAAADDEEDEGASFAYKEVAELLGKTGRMNDELQDIVRILASTGARLGEITGLQVKDFLSKDKAIDLRFNDIRRLKNRASIRVVPIVDQKALEALKKRTQGKQPLDPVFPRYGRRKGADAASAVLSKWLTTIGLRDPEADEVKTTHSLRHTFKDALRDTKATDDIKDMVQGHTKGDASSRYGKNELIRLKREAMGNAWRMILKKTGSRRPAAKKTARAA